MAVFAGLSHSPSGADRVLRGERLKSLAGAGQRLASAIKLGLAVFDPLR